MSVNTQAVVTTREVLAQSLRIKRRVRDADINTIEQSSWFDGQWYADRYADVAASGMTPAEHYLLLGEAWMRQAGPRFDPGFYLSQYPDIAAVGVSPLLHFIRHGDHEGRLSVALQAKALDDQLWQRVDAPLVEKRLQALLDHHDSWEVSFAAWALGRWYAWQGEWARCAAVLTKRHTLLDVQPRAPATGLLEIEALTKSRQLVAAWQRIRRLAAQYPDYSDVYLAKANLLAAQAEAYKQENPVNNAASEAGPLNDQMRLHYINQLFSAQGFCPLVLKSPCLPLTLDNLTYDQSAMAALVQPEPVELVSIIMPVFNAGAYLRTALQSIAEQTYPHFEVLVVDDASSDGSLAIAEAFSQYDQRFKVIAQPVNQGAYAARNRGLAAAKGDLLTVHDSDDWSHPQKLAQQVTGLRLNPQWKACFSDWVRCSTDVGFTRWRVEILDGWIYRNTSSFMFRREVFETLGFWDVVKVDGDTEYFHRVVSAFGIKSFGTVDQGVPLSFGRSLPSSLSQAGSTHLVTAFNGLRYDYQQAAAQWHAQAQNSSDLYMPANPRVRLFEAPAANLAKLSW